MALATLVGTKKPIRQSGTQIDFDPVRGITISEEYRSVGDNLAGIAKDYQKNKVAFTWKRGLIESSIRATYSGGVQGLPDVGQFNWQLLANETQKSLFESSFALDAEDRNPASRDPAQPGLLRAVKTAFSMIENGETDKESDYESSLEDDFGWGADDFADFDSLISLLKRGTTHVPFGQPVIRHTFSISNFYDGELPNIGVAEVLMTLEQTGLGDPDTGNRVIYALAQQIPAGAVHEHYAWSWRKLPGNAVTAANNRVEISREWWWGEWSTRVYPVA